jgi:adenine phosphoribosyltransferase
MKDFYQIEVAGLKRDLPVCPINENLSIAAFVLFGDVEMTVAAASELLKVAPAHDFIITAEAKGIPLIHEMARQNCESTYLVARKVAKLYMKNVFSVELHSITTAVKQTLCIDAAEAELMNGKNVLIVDDVISTGESIRAVEKLVIKAGGNIVGKMAVLAEGDAHLRDDIIFLEYLPLLNPDGSPIT